VINLAKNNFHQPVTLADVAARAKVSIKTVSRVVNNENYVGKETRQRVLDAIRELDYHPNRAARSLASSRSHVVGLLLPSADNPFFPTVMMGIVRVMHEHQYDVLIYNTDVEPERWHKGLRLLGENHVDGVVVCAVAGLPDAQLSDLLSKQRAAVLVNMVVPGNHAGVVRVDHVAGMSTLVNHLLASGRRRLAFITNPVDKFSTRERLRGYREALKAHGIEVDEKLIVFSPNNNDAVSKATRVLLANQPDVDAIMCFNDMMAASVLRTCMEIGVRVPDQVAVTGFDDIPFADLFKQSLTTMHVPRFDLGVKAAELLLERIKGNTVVSEIVITPQLVVRESAP
jgi:LacI family transcriptional regulator